MKKSIASLLTALLILSLIACGVLFMEGQSLKMRLQDTEKQMDAAQNEVSVLRSEKEQWMREKKAVGKTIGTVKTVLMDTLKELDDVTDVFKTGITDEAPPEATALPDQETKAPSATEKVKATPSPKATTAPVATASPEAAVKSPSATEKAQETLSPKVTPKMDATQAPKATKEALSTKSAEKATDAASTPAPSATPMRTPKK